MKILVLLPVLLVFGCMNTSVRLPNKETGEMESISLSGLSGPMMVRESRSVENTLTYTAHSKESDIWLLSPIEVKEEAEIEITKFRFLTPKDFLSGEEKNERLIETLNQIHSDREEGEPTLWVPISIYLEW
jgi:hypothetical protein